MTGLADVDGFKICIQVCIWLGFRLLTYGAHCLWVKERARLIQMLFIYSTTIKLFQFRFFILVLRNNLVHSYTYSLRPTSNYPQIYF